MAVIFVPLGSGHSDKVFVSMGHHEVTTATYDRRAFFNGQQGDMPKFMLRRAVFFVVVAAVLFLSVSFPKSARLL